MRDDGSNIKYDQHETNFKCVDRTNDFPCFNLIVFCRKWMVDVNLYSDIRVLDISQENNNHVIEDIQLNCKLSFSLVVVCHNKARLCNEMCLKVISLQYKYI